MNLRVTSRQGEPVELLLRRFKRACLRAGLFREVKKRTYYEKPSERRRRQAKEAVRKARRAVRRDDRRRTAES